MKTCKHKLQYLSRSLVGPAHMDFEDHLQDCVSCRQAVSRASLVDDRLTRLYDQLPMPQTSVAKAQALVFQLRKRSNRNFFGRPWVLATSSLVLAVVGLAIVFAGRTANDPDSGSRTIRKPIEVLQSQQAHVMQATSFGGKVLLVPAQGNLLVQWGQDRIGLQSHSQVAILPYHDEMRLILEQGNLSIQAGKRKLGRSLVVQAGAFSIRVVGTRFRVRYEKQGVLEVSVGEGEVLVTSDRDPARHRLRRGQRLQIALDQPAAVSPLSVRSQRELIRTLRTAARPVAQTTRQQPEPVVKPSGLEQPIETKPKQAGHDRLTDRKVSSTQAVPATRRKAAQQSQGQPVFTRKSADKMPTGDLRLYRSWILAGEYDKAQESLIAYLDKHPLDVDHWWLLAECRRKAQRTQPALDAYQKVIALAEGGPNANRARFHAAVLYQDQIGNHVQASQLLGAYLATDLRWQPLREWAQLRLARCLIALSKQDQAIEILTLLTHKAKDSSVQAQARLLLKKLSDVE